MTLSQPEERTRFCREKTRKAIALAMQSLWQEAIQVNQDLVDQFPEDVDAFNRLGRALAEVGHYTEARNAFQRALQLSPNNAIARKNLERLTHLKDAECRPKEGRKLVPPHFIEESGKAGRTSLHNLAPAEVLARMAAGDPVHLVVRDGALVVESAPGEYLGRVEPRLALRLIRLMRGGNQYEAALTSINEREAVVLIREVYRHPSQIGTPSFPSRASESLHYPSEPPVSYGPDEEEDVEGERPPLYWGEEETGPLAEDQQLAGAPEEPDADALEKMGGVDLQEEEEG